MFVNMFRSEKNICNRRKTSTLDLHHDIFISGDGRVT